MMGNASELITRFSKNISVIILVLIMTIASIYTLWGWLTINDLQEYCQENSLNYEKTKDKFIEKLSPTLSSIKDTISNKEGGELKVEFESNDYRNPFIKYLIPFQKIVIDAESLKNKAAKEGAAFEFFFGAILEPFLAVTEKTGNALFCLSIGYLVGILVVGVKALNKTNTTYKYILMRPIVGALGALLCYIIVISGGALIWNQVSGEKGLSIGLISVIGSMYVEKFTSYLILSA